MVARLKLKGIDGRAPQGVNRIICSAPKSMSLFLCAKKAIKRHASDNIIYLILLRHYQIAGNS